MTAAVKEVLDAIKDLQIFNEEALFFIGGTALSYYLDHRISEDIDIISPDKLNYKAIIKALTEMGAKKIADKDASALKMQGLWPDEYSLKFALNDI